MEQWNGWQRTKNIMENGKIIHKMDLECIFGLIKKVIIMEKCWEIDMKDFG